MTTRNIGLTAMNKFKEYRFPGDDFIFYGKEEVDDEMRMLRVRLEMLSDAVDNQYKINIELCRKIDELKAKKPKPPK